MRRLVEAETAAVIDRRQALVGAFRIMNAVITMAARHQRRDHHLRSHAEWFAHEVFFEFRADLDEHAADFVAERERPRQLLRPVALQDMQIGAANAAGADFYQRRLLRNFRPWHVANNRPRAGALISANTNPFHEIPPALRRLLIAGRGRTETYLKPVALPMYGLRGLAAQLTGPSRRLKLRQLRATAANPSLTLPAVGSDGTGKRLFGGEDGVSAKKTDPSGLPGATALSARESASARPLHAPGPARISMPDHQHVTGGAGPFGARHRQCRRPRDRLSRPYRQGRGPD